MVGFGISWSFTVIIDTDAKDAGTNSMNLQEHILQRSESRSILGRKRITKLTTKIWL